MGNSLQDQLLKAGLVNEHQLRKAKTNKRQENKQHRNKKTQPADQNKLQAQQLLAEKAERDRQLNLQRKATAERKAIAAQIRQLIETNRQPREGGELPYNFVDSGKVKKIYVSEALRTKVVQGKLAIVKLDGKYELVPPDIAEKIRTRDERRVVFQNDTKHGDDSGDSDDPYAKYQVPDDLIW